MSGEFENTPGHGRRRSFGRLLGFAALIGFGLLAGSSSPAQAATVSVYAAPTATGASDCSSPANACTITDALTLANGSSVLDDMRIVLGNGTYLLPSPTPTALPVTFAGPSLTFMAGSGTPTLNGRKATRLISVGPASNVIVDGLELVSGQASATGGAILNDGKLEVTDSTFIGNNGANGGAIGTSAGSTSKIEDSTFSNNTASAVGGGALISFGTTIIGRSAFLNNEAPVNGGGINIQPGGDVTISNSTIAGNVSGGLGGGMSNLGVVDVQSSTIANNTATSGSVIATGNTDATFAGVIVADQSSGGDACNPNGTAIVDAGYNLDTDGTCVSSATPAEGSHSGTTAYGASTYGEVLDSYLADAPANNGGPTKTIALLNQPVPATTLANPAFNVVPPGFDLPAEVGGQTAACSISDQRGVLPATSANCAIGAYLLQATATTVASSAPAVARNAPVTYTATVVPAPDGGTVAFDDGAGNPATTQCASQSVVAGEAKCTVSYATPGTYSASASYSGDGDSNNFAASASVDPASTTVVSNRPVKILGSKQNRKTGAITIKVQIPSAGTVKLIGYKQLASTSRDFGSGGVKKFKATPKGNLARSLDNRGRGRALVKFQFLPDVGAPVTKSKVFRFFKDAVG